MFSILFIDFTVPLQKRELYFDTWMEVMGT